MFSRGRSSSPWVLPAVLIAALGSQGCDEAQRKKELTAATRASDSSSASSASASAHKAPEREVAPEKAHTRTVLARFKKPKGLAVEGGSAYVMDALSGDKEQNEILDLLRVALPAGGEPARVATKLHSAGTPLVLKGDIFFATGGDKPNGAADRLMKASADGGAGASPVSVAPKALASADPAVASDGTNLYYLSATDDKAKLDVMSVPVAGGKPVKIASGDRSARVVFIAADAKFVYWPEAGRLMKAPVSGERGDAKEVVKVVYAWAAASDGNYLYWSDSPGDNMGTIRRIKVDGSGAAETLASGFSFPVGLALDDKSVFFVNHDAEDGGVYRVSKAGGTTATLIRGQNHPKRIAVDDRHVYWINVGEGTLSQTDK